MPKTYTLERSQTFRQTPEELFDFFADASNLSAITPGFLNFRILTPMPVRMEAGAILEYRLSLHGLPVRWKTEIESFDAPHAFVDRQLKGPYRLWHHSHLFERTETGTTMRDVVRYQMPYGPLGRLVRALWIRRTLDRIFDHRQEALRQIFDSASIVG